MEEKGESDLIRCELVISFEQIFGLVNGHFK